MFIDGDVLNSKSGPKSISAQGPMHCLTGTVPKTIQEKQLNSNQGEMKKLNSLLLFKNNRFYKQIKIKWIYISWRLFLNTIEYVECKCNCFTL